MNDETVNGELATQYAAALRDYLAGVEGNPLLRAYRLGRQAIAENLSLSALARIHQRVMADFSAEAIALGEGVDLELQSEEFFREALAPFERTSLGSDEAMTRMRLLNESLARTNRRLIEINREKDQAIAALRQSEETLRGSHLDLEKRLKTQTSALEATGATLRAEIAERKLTEIALRESEARFRTIFEKAGIGIALLDREGRIRECNFALQEMLGFSAKELHGKVIFDLSFPEDYQISVERFKGLIEGQYKHYSLDKRFIRKNGTTVWVRKIVSGIYGFRGELQFAVDMIEDITESKVAEESLRESEAGFRQIAYDTRMIGTGCQRPLYLLQRGGERHSRLRCRGNRRKAYYDLFFPEDRSAALAPKLIAREEPFSPGQPLSAQGWP